MKRLRRIIFDGLTMLSRVLCLATAGLWIRSYWRQDSIVFNTRQGINELHILPGMIHILRQPSASESEEGFHVILMEHLPASRNPDAEGYFASEKYRIARCRYGHFFTSMANDAWWIVVPIWWPIIVLGLPSLGLAVATRRAQRLQKYGFCRHCGYDLRATPDRCPECGTVQEKVKA